jgi:ubiquinone/menaquinone biosynthesis C-methylase UbiE
MTEGARRISFDQAAGYYDQTRWLPEPAGRRLTDLLVEELRTKGRALEVGVGTGRIAIPLHQAGVPLVGVDVSRAMMQRLVEKTGGRAPFPLVRGDALRLPFPEHAFGAAYAAHVLHLIPDWERALHEMARVVVPGGTVLLDVGTPPGRRWREAINRRFERETGRAGLHVGVRDAGQVDRAMEALGASRRLLHSLTVRVRDVPERTIAELEAGLFSWTWDVEPEALRRAARETRRWAADRYGPLDQPRWRAWTIQWRAFDLPRDG